MVWEFNDEGSKSLSKLREERIANESRNILNGLLGRVTLFGILCSGKTDGGSKKACRNSVKKELRKNVET